MDMINKTGKRGRILIYFLVIILILVGLNIVLFNLAPRQVNVTKTEIPSFFSQEGKTIVNMNLPAIDDAGNGVATLLKVEAINGTGRTLTDIENLLFWADTQQSMRMARSVANKISKVNLANIDLIYSVEANASIVGGESAGAALAIATIAAIEGKQINPNVMITGTINHDGSIGPVSGILEKAKASEQAGAEIFLVPLLQSGDVIYETEQYCEKFGLSEICSSETRPRKVNVSEEAGIEVIEVGSIEAALTYFFD